MGLAFATSASGDEASRSALFNATLPPSGALFKGD